MFGKSLKSHKKLQKLQTVLKKSESCKPFGKCAKSHEKLQNVQKTKKK